MGRRQTTGSAWTIPAGHLNAAITALDAALSQNKDEYPSRRYFRGFKASPAYAHDIADHIMTRYHYHSVDACINLGHKRVWSMAQAVEFWGAEVIANYLPEVYPSRINEYVKGRYTYEDLQEAARENREEHRDWRLVFYSGLNIWEQASRVNIGSKPLYHFTDSAPLGHISTIPTVTPGAYLVEFHSTCLIHVDMKTWTYTPKAMNDWLKNVCSGAKGLQVVPLPILTEGIAGFLSQGQSLPSTEWYYTGVQLKQGDPLSVVLARCVNGKGIELATMADAPDEAGLYMYFMKTPRKPAKQ